MSWRSPLIVPMTAVESGLKPDPMSSGSSSATAAFMARALMSISGTKISPVLERPPTTPMASVIQSRISLGGEPLVDACLGDLDRRLAVADLDRES